MRVAGGVAFRGLGDGAGTVPFLADAVLPGCLTSATLAAGAGAVFPTGAFILPDPTPSALTLVLTKGFGISVGPEALRGDGRWRLERLVARGVGGGGVEGFSGAVVGGGRGWGGEAAEAGWVDGFGASSLARAVGGSQGDAFASGAELCIRDWRIVY